MHFSINYPSIFVPKIAWVVAGSKVSSWGVDKRLSKVCERRNLYFPAPEVWAILNAANTHRAMHFPHSTTVVFYG